jgi:hypothetical protein
MLIATSSTRTRSGLRFALADFGRAWIRLGSRKSPKPEKCFSKPQTPKNPLHAVLLEWNRRGVAEYPWRDKLTGDAPGCEHLGRPMRPMREKLASPLVLLLGCPVESRLGFEPESVCITHSPKIHAPTSKRRRV